jgi:hypothetical protein
MTDTTTSAQNDANANMSSTGTAGSSVQECPAPPATSPAIVIVEPPKTKPAVVIEEPPIAKPTIVIVEPPPETETEGSLE